MIRPPDSSYTMPFSHPPPPTLSQSHRGRPKFKITLEPEPVAHTVGSESALRVFTSPMEIVGLTPSLPSLPSIQSQSPPPPPPPASSQHSSTSNTGSSPLLTPMMHPP